MSTPTPLLIIVHPGSACGSADMNLGAEAAEVQRLDMQMLIENWEGGVAVIDGELSDELEGFRRSWQDLGGAITDALDRAQQSGLISERVFGDDDGDYRQMDAARDLVQKHGLTPDKVAITLTGAWIDDDGDGCVHSVREALEALGFQPVVEDAMSLDFELDTEDDDMDEDDLDGMDTIEEEQAAPSTNTRRAKPR